MTQSREKIVHACGFGYNGGQSYIVFKGVHMLFFLMGIGCGAIDSLLTIEIEEKFTGDG